MPNIEYLLPNIGRTVVPGDASGEGKAPAVGPSGLSRQHRRRSDLAGVTGPLPLARPGLSPSGTPCWASRGSPSSLGTPSIPLPGHAPRKRAEELQDSWGPGLPLALSDAGAARLAAGTSLPGQEAGHFLRPRPLLRIGCDGEAGTQEQQGANHWPWAGYQLQLGSP